MMKYFVTFLLLYLSTPFAGEYHISVLQHDGTPLNSAVIAVYGKEKTPVPPTRENKTPVEISQKNFEFSPHTSVVQVTDEVVFHNLDTISHHVYAITGPMNFSFMIQAGEKNVVKTFPRSGIVAMGCNIHDWMNGYINVVDTPYFGQTSNNHGVSLNIPDKLKEKTVEVWHPQMDETILVSLMSDNTEIRLTRPLLPSPELSTLQDIEFTGEP